MTAGRARKLIRMSPNCQVSGSVRSSAAVNEEIRALWADPRVRLTQEGRARLEQLYAEWAAAVRRDREGCVTPDEAALAAA